MTAEYQHCAGHQRPLPASRFMSPTDVLCIICKIEARSEDRPIRPLFDGLFRAPKPQKKRLTVKAQGDVQFGT